MPVQNEAADLEHATGPVFSKIVGSGYAPPNASTGWPSGRRAQQASYAKEDFSPHSLRARFMTECGLRNIAVDQAAHLSKHTNLDTARGY